MEYKLSNVDVKLYKKNGFVTPNIPVPESLLQKMKDGANNVLKMNPNKSPEALINVHLDDYYQKIIIINKIYKKKDIMIFRDLIHMKEKIFTCLIFTIIYFLKIIYVSKTLQVGAKRYQYSWNE